MENFWENIDLDNTELQDMIPLNILKQQARYLEEKTNGILRGEVLRVAESPDILNNKNTNLEHRFILHFFIFSPSLKYRYKLFSVEQESLTKIYPLLILYGNSNTSDTCITASEFIVAIQEYIQSLKVQKIVKSIYEQSKPIEEELSF